ncbi:uncharacterized protein V3H82_011850 [Fundulus diaphanus]
MLLRLCFMISGAVALTTLQQPPVVTVLLGQDVLLPCELQVTQDEKVQNKPVLYWMDDRDGCLFPPTETGRYAGRVEVMNKTFSNKSIVLKNVRWSDSRTYQCKLSIETDKRGHFRERGTKTTLIIYDAMNFDLISNGSLLCCEVNVSLDLGFALSVSHAGRVLQSLDSPATAGSNRTGVTLSRNVSLTGGGEYECRLWLGNDLITSSTFHSNLTDVEWHPEPWLLYGSVLLVPVLVLLVLVAATLMRR